MKRTIVFKVFVLCIIPVLGIMLACTREGQYAKLLRVESIIDSLPDTAANILKKIVCDTIENQEDKAFIALLQAEVDYKLYVDTSVEDTVLAFAEDYFFSKNDCNRLMRTLFQRAIKQYYDGEFSESFISALKGLEIAETLQNIEYLAKFNEHIGDIYCNSGDSEAGLQYIRKSIDYFKLGNKEGNIICAYVDVSHALSNCGKYNESLAVLDSLTPNIPKEDISFICYALEATFDPLIKIGNTKQALHNAQRLLELSPGYFQPDKRQLLEIMIETGNLKAAEELLKEIKKDNPNWQNDSRVLRILVKYYQSKQIVDSALLMAEKRIELEHEGVLEALHQSIDKAQTERYKEIAESNKLKILEKERVLLLFFSGFILLFLCGVQIYRFKKNKYILEIKEHSDEVRLLKEALSELNNVLASIEERSTSDRERFNDFISDRIKSINTLCNRFFGEKNVSDGARILLYKVLVREISKIKQGENLRVLEDYLNFNMNNLADRLRSELGFKNEDYLFLLFSHLKFDPKAICILCKLEYSYYYNKRQRMKAKIEKENLTSENKADFLNF